MLPDPGKQLHHAKIERPALPLLERYRVRGRQVLVEHGLHLAAELCPEHHGVQFVVVQKAAPVQVGRADRGPDAVDVTRPEALRAGLRARTLLQQGGSRLGNDPSQPAHQ